MNGYSASTGQSGVQTDEESYGVPVRHNRATAAMNCPSLGMLGPLSLGFSPYTETSMSPKQLEPRFVRRASVSCRPASSGGVPETVICESLVLWNKQFHEAYPLAPVSRSIVVGGKKISSNQANF